MCTFGGNSMHQVSSLYFFFPQYAIKQYNGDDVFICDSECRMLFYFILVCSVFSCTSATFIIYACTTTMTHMCTVRCVQCMDKFVYMHSARRWKSCFFSTIFVVVRKKCNTSRQSGIICAFRVEMAKQYTVHRTPSPLLSSSSSYEKYGKAFCLPSVVTN